MSDGAPVYGPGVSLTTEQTRRAWCLALAMAHFAGRGVNWQNMVGIAEWLYRGELP